MTYVEASAVLFFFLLLDKMSGDDIDWVIVFSPLIVAGATFTCYQVWVWWLELLNDMKGDDNERHF